MNKTLLASTILATALAGSACTDAETISRGNGSDAGSVDTDAGTGGADTGPGGTGLSCDYPTTGYGSGYGAKLEPFTLPQCDGTPYSFLNEDYCESTLTVISIAAGWCMPCMRESEQLTANVVRPYADRGVRVLQVLVQDPDYNAPDEDFCNEWVDRYNLENIELRDAANVVGIYFPGGSLPSTLIVDNEGTIRFYEQGASDGLVTLTRRIDQLLECIENGEDLSGCD